MPSFNRRGIQAGITPGIPGQTGSIINSYPLRGRDQHRLFCGFFDFSGPATIFGQGVTEGTDVPFLPHRWSLDTLDSPRRIRRLKDLRVSLAAMEGLGNSPLILLLAPPDDSFALSVLNYYELPDSYREKLYRKRLASAHASWDYVDTWAGRLPASAYTMDSCDLLEEIQFHLLIPPDRGQTWDLWTLAEILGYLNQRITDFLGKTWLLTETYSSTESGSTVSLPPLIDIIRVAWNGSPLQPLDKLAADSLSPGWETTSGTPYGYIENPQDPGDISLVPLPSTSGTFHMIYVPIPSLVSATCGPLPVPDLFTWAIKWGVVADCLSKQGEASDPERASYAEKRYEEGIALAKLLNGTEP